MQYVLPWPAHLIANILYNDYAEDFMLYPSTYLESISLLPIFYIMITKKTYHLNVYHFAFLLYFTYCIYYHLFFATIEKNKLNISKFYRDSITFRTNIMHTPTIFDQTDCTGTLACYDGTNPGEYLSDSDNYNDNDSDCGSDDYNNYESNYESDNEEASCSSTSTTEAVKERKVNVTYTLRNFSLKIC